MGPKGFVYFLYGGLYASCIWYICTYPVNDKNILWVLALVGTIMGSIGFLVSNGYWLLEHWNEL
jgi:hypothetical protein